MAAGATYEPIATTTLGSSSSSVTFSSISQAYTDLVLVMNYGMTSGSGLNTAGWRFNGDTSGSTLYSQTILQGDGSSASGNQTTSTNLGLGLAYTSNNSIINANVILQIMNYSNTTTFKSAIVRGNTAGNAVTASAFLYRSTSAITSIEIVKEYTPIFCAGSTFTLYGIAAA
jgi:hypothetical protein